MLDESRRNLRVRKGPKYLNSDEQDPDKLSFSQLKCHNDYASSNAQKLQDAKTLIKFINKANKNYRAYLSQVPSRNILPEKTQTISKQKKVEIQNETGKKANDQHKDNKNQPSKKPKQISSSKPQNFINNSQTIKNTESYINKIKQLGSISSIANFSKGLCSDQLKKLQSLYPQMKDVTFESFRQHVNLNLFSGPIMPKKQQVLSIPKQIFPQEKLFKRSAYHVAIAYHIYLKNLKQKDKITEGQLDPTYWAKKIRQQSRR